MSNGTLRGSWRVILASVLVSEGEEAVEAFGKSSLRGERSNPAHRCLVSLLVTGLLRRKRLAMTAVAGAPSPSRLAAANLHHSLYVRAMAIALQPRLLV
jgi:hypothetical protein